MSKRVQLQGGCFVTHCDSLEFLGQGPFRWARIIGEETASAFLSMFLFELGAGASPALREPASETVLYLLDGNCRLEINCKPFDLHGGCGAHVRKDESWRLINQHPAPARILTLICPRQPRPRFDEAEAHEFDMRFPDRVVDGAMSRMQPTSDRFYKLLVGPETGSRQITQFIGRIPKSKAPDHYHLYEEAICILSGEGRMWTGEQSAPVRPGSLIFLPREQRHSLECTSDGGMELVGMFYPAGSPAINYR